MTLYGVHNLQFKQLDARRACSEAKVFGKIKGYRMFAVSLVLELVVTEERNQAHRVEICMDKTLGLIHSTANVN